MAWWVGIPNGSVFGSSPPERMKASKREMRSVIRLGSAEVGGRMTGIPPALWTAWA